MGVAWRNCRASTNVILTCRDGMSLYNPLRRASVFCCVWGAGAGQWNEVSLSQARLG